jgi:hypothetical protein
VPEEMKMTTLIEPADFDLSVAENTPAGESIWSRILDRLEELVGKSWSYLNEDMGPVDRDDDYHFMYSLLFIFRTTAL